MPTKYMESVDNKIEVIPPKKYAVIIYDDDFTPIDFVERVLINIFNKQKDEAMNLIEYIQKSGKGQIGLYTYDIAMTKKIHADLLSKKNNHPLKITIEETKESV